MRQAYASQRSEANVEIDDAQSAAVWDPYFQWFHLLPRAQSREDSDEIDPCDVLPRTPSRDDVESSDDFGEIAVRGPHVQ